MKTLVTGAAGFICGYLIEQLLEAGHEVVGLDNFSKYGRAEKSYDRHPHYTFIEGDAKNAGLLKELIAECDHFVAAAAMIGGNRDYAIKLHEEHQAALEDILFGASIVGKIADVEELSKQYNIGFYFLAMSAAYCANEEYCIKLINYQHTL